MMANTLTISDKSKIFKLYFFLFIQIEHKTIIQNFYNMSVNSFTPEDVLDKCHLQ